MQAAPHAAMALTIAPSHTVVIDMRINPLYFSLVNHNNHQQKNTAMKKNLLTLACISGLLFATVFSASAAVNEKTLQSFRAVFGGAQQVRWTEYADHDDVSFMQNEVLVKASYDKNGNMMSTIRYYKEQRLPLNILCKVKKEYPAEKINSVTEETTSLGTSYYIQLKGAKSWTILRSDESGNFEIHDKFDRADL